MAILLRSFILFFFNPDTEYKNMIDRQIITLSPAHHYLTLNVLLIMLYIHNYKYTIINNII